MRKLNDKIRAIRGMQDYQRVRMTRNGQRDDSAMGWTGSGLARLATRLLCFTIVSAEAHKWRQLPVTIEMWMRVLIQLSVVPVTLFQLREENFRDTSESTNSRVLWWSIAQTVVLIVTAVYQLTNLKGFFKSKKLA